LYQEDFDDQDIDQPTVGTVTARMDWDNVPAPVEFTDYDFTSTGHDGSGYAFHGYSVDVWIRWAYELNGWPTDEMYVSYYQRFNDFVFNGSDGLPNVKQFYPHFGTIATCNYFHSSIYNTSGTSLYVSAYSSAANDCAVSGVNHYISHGNSVFDGNWHRFEFWLKESTGEFKVWIDKNARIGDTPDTYQTMAGGGWDWSAINYLTMPHYDAGNSKEGGSRDYDSIEVWDGMPDAVTCSNYDGNSSGCVAAGCVYCTDNSTCGAAECCGDDAAECDETGCGTSWPSYYWCTDVCQVAACPQKTLTVTKDGTGSGTLVSNPSGINCGSTCNHDFDDNSDVVVTAFADVGSSFTSWSVGDCEIVDGDKCTVSMGVSAQSVVATFTDDSVSCSTTNFFACLNQTVCEAASLYWWDNACRTITEPTDTIGAATTLNGEFTDWTGGMPDNWSTYSNTNGIVEDTYGCKLTILDTEAHVHVYQNIPATKTYRYSFNIIELTDSFELWTEAEGSMYFSTVGTKTGLLSLSDTGDPDNHFYLQIPLGAIRSTVIDNFVLKEAGTTQSVQITGSVIIQ
jgi:hypothetical protein